MPTPTIVERVEAARHLEMSIAWKGVLGFRNPSPLYQLLQRIPHFKEYRTRMVTSNASEEVFGL